MGDCVTMIQHGAGRHLPINLFDVDPYGDPWPCIDAFLASERPRPATLYLVVNDGLRHFVQMGGSWRASALKEVVKRYGNNLFDKYLDVCSVLLNEKAAQAGYTLSRFDGYYCGANDYMTHYYAVLTASSS